MRWLTVGKLLALVILLAVFIYFWRESYLLPLKIFVVYLHELSHALATLLTGGHIKTIAIGWDESGYVVSQGGNFFIIALAGYLGSIFWGSLMLYVSLRGRGGVIVSLLVASVLFVFTFWPQEQELSLIKKLPQYFSGLFWGGLLIATALLARQLNRLLLFFMGGLTSLYSLYDLNDFFNGEIMKTDAGILANYLLPNSPLKQLLAYALAFTITIFSLWLLYRMLLSALKVPELKESESTPASLEITPEMLTWLEQQKDKQ